MKIRIGADFWIELILIINCLVNAFLGSDAEPYVLIASLIILIVIVKKIYLRTGVDVWLFFMIAILGLFASWMGADSVNNHIIVRGISYCVMSALVMLLGIYYSKSNVSYQRVVKIIVKCAIFYGIIDFLLLIQDGIWNFNALRENRSGYLVLFGAFILGCFWASEEIVFSRKLDMIAFIVLLILSFVGFSRTNLLTLMILFLLIYCKKSKLKRNFLPYMFIALAVILGLFFLIWNYKDSNTYLGNFIAIIQRGLSEAEVSNDFSSATSISLNWRGYENYIALRQFRESSVFQKIFGSGFAGVYAGENAKYVVQNTEYLALLHNGYLTVLNYSGIMGLICLISFSVKKIINIIKNKSYNTPMGFLCFGLILTISVIMYVVRGFIGKSVFFEACFLIGYYCASSDYAAHGKG